MRMLVTGASGFIGRATVAAALTRGHRVRAVVRGGADGPAWGGEVEPVRADLRDSEAVRAAVPGVDVVIHLAAAMQGDDAEHAATTVGGTAHLLEAMAAAEVRRLVLVSSIAVYDVTTAAAEVPVDESCPLEPRPEERDPYCRAKLAQEALVRERAAALGVEALILRPGVVHGPGRLWSPRLGIRLGRRLWVIPAAAAPLPLISVENCAQAIVLAAERRDVAGIALNVVDDGAPGRLEHVRRIRPQLEPHARVLVLPAWLVRPAGGLVHAILRLARGLRPIRGPFSPRGFAARFTPRSYVNAAIKDRLGWMPRDASTMAGGPAEGAGRDRR